MTYTRDKILEHRQLWLQELRSGKHMQGRGCLMDAAGKKCCLGVAEFISGRPYRLTTNENMYVFATGYHDLLDVEIYAEHFVLTPETQDWLGLKNSSPRLGGGKGALVYMNDEGAYFSEIADAIEIHGFYMEDEADIMRGN